MVLAKLLMSNNVPTYVREEYILSGYRPVNAAFSTCIKSIFIFHNETFNIWTHLLPIFYFLYFMMCGEDLDLPTNLPMYGFYYAMFHVFASSTTAHLFSCGSYFWNQVLFMLDYGGITIYGISASMACYFYCHPKTPILSGGPEVFLLGIVISGVFANWTCCLNMTNNKRQTTVCNAVVRVLAFAVPFFVGSTPMILRTIGPYVSTLNLGWLPSSFQDMITSYRYLLYTDASFRSRYICHLSYMIIAGIFQMTKIPECFFPRYFDIVGHSHQLFHVFVFLGLREMYWLVVEDIQSIHDNNALYMANAFEYTILVYLVVITNIVAATVWFGCSIDQQKLEQWKPNKDVENANLRLNVSTCKAKVP